MSSVYDRTLRLRWWVEKPVEPSWDEEELARCMESLRIYRLEHLRILDEAISLIFLGEFSPDDERAEIAEALERWGQEAGQKFFYTARSSLFAALTTAAFSWGRRSITPPPISLPFLGEVSLDDKQLEIARTLDRREREAVQKFFYTVRSAILAAHKRRGKVVVESRPPGRAPLKHCCSWLGSCIQQVCDCVERSFREYLKVSLRELQKGDKNLERGLLQGIRALILYQQNCWERDDGDRAISVNRAGS